MATIKAIEGRSVHQIQSGQVIVDLCSVVKELIENSLDAGATSVEVRFRNHGLEAIEVADNGNGLSPDDYETVALKHYTSKLSSYDDLDSLHTFGFRGEALSSLCALSKFRVVTARAEDGAKGKRLDFETSGKLKSQTIVAAQKGTTVYVEDLFYNLPVRRKELEKNIKREYAKVIGLLHAYACIGIGVRFAISNQMPKGKKTVVFSTKANPTTKENIVNVFGAKTLLALVKLDLTLDIEPSKGPTTQGARNLTTQGADHSLQVSIQGHISKPVFGEGRSAPDRQMFFVNSRPCLLPQVSKAINEVYRSFNVSQSPFIFANLVMDTTSYDVNVSPDKRTILLHDQAALLEHLKTSLTEMFDQTDHTVPQSALPNRKLPAYQPLTIQSSTLPRSDISSSGQESDFQQEHSSDIPSETLVTKWASRDLASHRAILRQEKSSRKPENKDQSALIKAFMEKNAIAFQNTDAAILQPASNVDSSPPDHSSWPLQQPGGTLTSPSNGSEESETLPAVVDGASETPIEATAPSSQKGTPGSVQTAFDRMRPKRTPQQAAQITIGEHETTTTIIGRGPAYKRPRVHAPANSQAIAAFGCNPTLAKGLRHFAAPGTQMEIDGSEPEEGLEGDLSAGSSQTQHETSGEEGNDDEDGDGDGDVEDSQPVLGDFEGELQPLSPSTEMAISVDDAADTGRFANTPLDEDPEDEDFVDELEKKSREDEKVARLIQAAEAKASNPLKDNLRRAMQTLKNSTGRTDSTTQLAAYLDITISSIKQKVANMSSLHNGLSGEDRVTYDSCETTKDTDEDINPENKLSLTVMKEDFGRMQVLGQFNLGFILAMRPASNAHAADELFIIDQHAADEKYNYERLQRTVNIQNQRLVRPKLLELSAVEEELILNHQDALKANGFEIEIRHGASEDGEEVSKRDFHLTTLPISKEKTFELSDLEELLHLLSERPIGGSEIPRPRKVQRMLAMRACRSSIMVGKTLTPQQMQKVVRNMGEMDKPWNCPHGRPTMRHLAGLGAWRGWQEGDVVSEESDFSQTIDWKEWLEDR